MARGHGRILTSIWEDADFLTLTPAEQRLYLFLISQPNLNHAGLLPLTLRRWARKAAGLTVDSLLADLYGLDMADFVLIDEDTEEILIRSFVRNDGVWKQPRVMGAMVSGAMEITSWRLRAALLREIDRIPLDELSDAPGAKGAPSIRFQVFEHITALRKAFGDIPPNPPRTRSTTAREPLAEEVAEGVQQPLPEGDPQGSTHVRASARARALPLPLSPAPIPTPLPEGVAEGAPLTARAADDLEPSPIDDDGFALNDAMRRWAVATFGTALDVDYETAQFIAHHRAQRSRRHSWPDEWQKWMRRSAKWASEKQQRPQLRAVSGGFQPYQQPDPAIYDQDEGF
jgi:phage-related protein